MESSLRRRFYAKVRRTDYCWFWTGTVIRGSYGMLLHSHGRYTTAHRISYELHYGEIPAGLFVLHKCDNPRCVNPAHLFAGTHTENMRDMVAKGRNYQKVRPEAVARGDRNGSRTKPWRLKRGEDTPTSKLKEADVKRIRELVAAGVVQRVLAAEYQVNYRTINAVVVRKTWRHVQ